MKKIKKAEQLKRDDVIRVEYGDYGNMVDFVVDRVEPYGSRLNVSCHTKSISTGFVMEPAEEVEIVREAS